MAAEPGFVFVSYANADTDTVSVLVQALELRGVPFRYDRDLALGEAWAESLTQWLNGAAAVLVVWSPRSASSASVINEATQARDRLVPVTLTDMSAVPRPFQDLQTLNFGGWAGDTSDPRLDQLGQFLLSRLATSSGGDSSTIETAASRPADTSQAVAAAQSIVDPAERSRALTSIAREMADTDPEAAQSLTELALSAAHSITDGAQRSLALTDLVELVGRIDPQRATAVANEALATDPGRSTTSLELTDDADAVQPASTAGAAPPASTLPPSQTVFDYDADTPGVAGAVQAADDQLGIEDDVRVLCQLAMARSTKPPLAIGLFGDWGTGKSFFMGRMQTRVQEMQDQARTLLARGGTSQYCDNVVQIPFNAWHYVDSNLWASMMTRIFEVLSERTPEAARDYLFGQLESTQSRLTQARRDKSDAWQQIDSLKKERSRLRQVQSAISGQRDEPVGRLIGALAELNLPGDQSASSLPKGVTTVADLHKAAQGARSTARLLERLLNSWPFRIVLVAAALIVLVGMGIIAAGGGDLVVRTVSVAAVVAPAVATAAGMAWRRFRSVVDIASQADDVEQWITGQLAELDERDRVLASDVEQAQEQADQAVRTIESVRTGNLVRQYVETRVTHEAYRDQLGVISLVRNDLQRLSDLCSPTEDGPGVYSMTARFDIQRVVLYIDDLDRCPPARVVEVLQAVHLLLAFPLFVVVVGVDSRWLITSLKIHYQRLLQDDRGGQESGIGAGQWEVSPADYLDKIFQIPLSLRPMTNDGYRALINNLMPARPGAPEAGPAPDGHDDAVSPAADSSDQAAGGGVTPATHTATPPRLTPRKIRQSVLEGRTLAIRFVLDGRRLVVVTSAGIWVWNRGATRDSRYVTAEIEAVHFSPGGGQLLYQTSTEWVAVDLATANRTNYPRPLVFEALAMGEEPYEVVYARDDALIRLCGQQTQWVSWSKGLIRKLIVAGERLLVWSEEGLWALRLPDLSDIRPLAAAGERGQLADIALDPRTRTLYSLTLYPGEVQIWPWSGDSWDPRGPVTLVPEGKQRNRLTVSSEGVFIEPASDLVHVTRQPPAVSSLAMMGTPDGGAGLAADYSTPRFAVRTGTTVIIGQQVGTGLAEQARFEVGPLEEIALGPTGSSLIATAGGGSYQLWYVGEPFVEEDISQLEIGPEEAGFIATLGPVVPTARAAKRLVNVYRVLRASRVGRDKLTDPASGEYKIALLLLSLVTGWPHLALSIFRELDGSTAKTWPELLEEVRAKRSVRDQSMIERGPGREDENDGTLEKFQQLFEDTHASLDRYRVWAPDIRRFSVPAND